MSYETANLNQTGRVATRVESDVEAVKAMTDRINRRTADIVIITGKLGYFEPPKAGNSDSVPTPGAANMADALRELSRAIDNLEGSMNLFN